MASGADSSGGRRYVNAAQAAELLGVRPETVVRLIERGRLPAIKLSRVYRIRLDDLRGLVVGDGLRVMEEAAAFAVAARHAGLARDLDREIAAIVGALERVRALVARACAREQAAG